MDEKRQPENISSGKIQHQTSWKMYTWEIRSNSLIQILLIWVIHLESD
jgi:hypothetical protein